MLNVSFFVELCLIFKNEFGSDLFLCLLHLLSVVVKEQGGVEA